MRGALGLEFHGSVLPAAFGILVAVGLLLGMAAVPSPASSATLSAAHPAKTAAATPTYVILVHGFDPTPIPAYSVWTAGTNEYQQLVNAGYVVGIVSYYGTFSLSWSNGTHLTDLGYFGTSQTPIETVALELGKEIRKSFAGQSGVHLDLIGHSMGGLVSLSMLEHVRFPGITVDHMIFLGSPLNGAPLSSLTVYANISGFQAAEMSQGSPFLTALHAWVPTARQLNPSTVWIVYCGDANPSWAAGFFGGGANDGLVEVSSATDVPHSHTYIFPDLHIPSLDAYSPGFVSYFEDQKVATEMLDNFAGVY